MVRFGDVKFEGGQGFSEAAPSQSETIRKTFRQPSGGGRVDRSGGTGTSRSGRAERAAAVKRAAERDAAAKKASAAAAKKAAEEKRVEEAKSLAEKMRIAREIVMSRQAQSEFQKMLRFRSNLIKRGVTEDKKMAVNKAGDKLEVSQWRDKAGNRVQRIKNFKDGTTTYSRFKKIGKNGVRRVGSVSMGGKKTFESLASNVKIKKSSDPKKLIVTFPNGKTGTINSTGRVVVSEDKAGNRYTFQDGKIVTVDGLSTSKKYKLKPTEKRKLTKLEKRAGLTEKDIEKGLTLKDYGLTESDVLGGLTTASVGGVMAIDSDDVFNLAFLASGVSLGKFALKKIANLPKNLKLFKDTIKIRSSGKGGVKKQLQNLMNFRRGQLAGAYLKAKNAQLKDKTMGAFVAVGGAVPKNVLKELNNKLRSVNIKPKDTTLSRYVQSFKVPSTVPRTEALIKMLKTGKMFTQKQLNNIPKFFNFKREGVLVTKILPSGNVKVVAMEYSRIGNKISHISYKVGVGTDTHAVVSTFKKVRKLATKKGVRVKHVDTAVVKSEILSQKKLSETVKKTVSQMKTKKVFFNGKRLTRDEIKSFASVLKSQTKVAANKRLSNVISKLYKKSPAYNISGITNVVRVKRTLNKIIFKSGKKKGRQVGVSKKGDFLEIGFTKARIPSSRVVRVVAKAKISPVGLRKPIKLKSLGNTKIDNTIRVVAKGVSKSTQKLVKLEVKKGATKAQVTNVKNAVMSIQTIIRPVVRSSKAVMPKSKIVSIKVNVKKILPGLSRTSKTSLVALTKSLSATQKIKRLAETPAQKNAAKNLEGRIFKRLLGLKPLSVSPFKRPSPTPKPSPRPFGRPRPTPRPTPKPKPKPFFKLKLKKANTRKLSKAVMTYGFVVKKGNKMVRLKLPPLTLRDAWDVGSHSLDHKLQRTGKLVPLGKNDVVAKLGKNEAGYFKKHSKKFRRTRIKKGRALGLVRTIIEKNKYISDTPSEKRALRASRSRTKKKTTKRVMSKKKLPKLSVLKSTKKGLILKRKRLVNKLKNR